jgi:uncharacterized membrane protein YdjX (TVP38/TMEM64 family)
MPRVDSRMTRSSNRLRLAVMALLIAAIVAAVWYFSATESGRQIMRHPTDFGDDARAWVVQHPFTAPLIFFGVYLLCALLLLPIWWIQILAGFAFGLVWGSIYTLLAAATGSTISMLFSRWLAGEWFRERIESRMERVRRLEEKLGHNGLLVVMAIRLMYFLPYGISNYLLGLTRITPLEVFIGSILGGFPALTIYVTAGADYTLFYSWRYWLTLASINLLLVSPLLLRYLWQRFFSRIGVE